MSYEKSCFDRARDNASAKPSTELLSDGDFTHSNSGLATAGIAGLHLPPNVSIEPITPATVPSFRRIIGLLLPIRYPDRFFAESVANVTSSSLAKAAIWQERVRPAKRKREEPSLIAEACQEDSKIHPSISNDPANAQQPDVSGTVVGGIQCRIEQLPFHPSLSTLPKIPDTSTGPRNYCYIQTLALLSPYRSKGIATALLEVIVATLCVEQCYAGTASIYAHVWEENEDALAWYVRRGFQVSNEVLRGYYRRLKPDGARIVWRDLEVRHYLRAKESVEHGWLGGRDSSYPGELEKG
ncbi:MAG: hypothetical protein Q9166_007732 [cf. Caloplaca sp. 2 TL-2023]